MLKEKRQIVMLPTDKASQIHLVPVGEFEEVENRLIKIDKQRLLFTKEATEYGYPPIFLCILSNEQIKEGDWYIRTDTNELLECRNSFTKEQTPPYCKKVIASTDKSLPIRFGEKNTAIPQIRESVVKAYIEDYNKGKQWRFVNVEYEDVLLEKDAINGKFSTIRLKLRDDNTVIVSPIQEVFTRDEVLDAIRKYATTYYEGNLEQWFNENY